MKSLAISAALFLSTACADLGATDTTPYCDTSHLDYYVTVTYCLGELSSVDVMCDPTGGISRDDCVQSEELSFSKTCDIIDKCWEI